jgi:glycosyltransferase involved in cell wall biosynthesis
MTEDLHVAVDARFGVLDQRGIGRYTRAVSAQLLAQPGVTLSFVAPGLLAPRPRIARALGVDPKTVTAAIPAAAQVLWSPSNGTDLPTALPCVTTVHDVVPFLFPAEGFKVREREQAPLRRTAERARTIVADSHYMAGEIALRLGVAPERIAVAPLGVSAPFSPGGERGTLSDGRPYVLHVGAHDMRKNVRMLVAAWQAAFPTADVALAFTRPPEVLPPASVVLDAGTDEQLAAYYRGALFVAVPSIDEGFGLPLLEALACGAPVIASRAAALPEVGGDVTAWIDDPDDLEEWAFTFRRLSRTPGALAELGARGPAQAAAFTWERCARLTLDVLRAAAA